MNTAQDWFKQANTLFEAGKFLEADKCLDEALALDPKFMQAYRWKFKLFYSLGKYHDMIKWCDKAIEVDPNYFFAYNSKGNACRQLGRHKEALEAYDKAIKIDPTHPFPHGGRANALSDLGRYEEALIAYDKNLELDPTDVFAYNGKGNQLERLGRNKEALEYFTKCIEANPKFTLGLCNRGKLLSKMGKQQEALADFKKIKQLLDSGYVDTANSAANTAFVNNTLRSIVELNDMSEQTEAVIKNADQTNPAVQKFLQGLQVLQESKDKVTADLIANIDKKDSSENNELMKELQRLKQEFAVIQKELKEVKTDIKRIDAQLIDIKEELDNKLDDFHKKLEKDLKTQDLSPEDQEKIMDYFKAFIETFSSLHVTAQVVDSGQVQIDTNSTKTTILSTIASFAPFIGGVLSSGIKSLGEFLVSKEIKTNARKMKGLASDSSKLSQLLGKTAHAIVMDKTKQKQILEITPEDLKQVSGSLFEKIKKICEKIGEQVDAYLYTELYPTPAARLGHNDANDLIGEWLNDRIDAFNVQAEFVKKTLNQQKKTTKEETETSGKNTNGRSSCCNMF